MCSSSTAAAGCSTASSGRRARGSVAPVHEGRAQALAAGGDQRADLVDELGERGIDRQRRPSDRLDEEATRAARRRAGPPSPARPPACPRSAPEGRRRAQLDGAVEQGLRLDRRGRWRASGPATTPSSASSATWATDQGLRVRRVRAPLGRRASAQGCQRGRPPRGGPGVRIPFTSATRTGHRSCSTVPSAMAGSVGEVGQGHARCARRPGRARRAVAAPRRPEASRRAGDGRSRHWSTPPARCGLVGPAGSAGRDRRRRRRGTRRPGAAACRRPWAVAFGCRVDGPTGSVEEDDVLWCAHGANPIQSC